MSQEIELKLALAPEALPALRAHPLIANAPLAEETASLINTYFDTPALELRRAKIALRLRKTGSRWLQTVKCAAPSIGGLASRPEWEQPYDGRFNFAPVSDQAVRDQLEDLRGRLGPVFTTNFERETRVLHPRPGAEVLAMIDHGQIESAGRQAPICELELELVSGEVGDLYALALEFAQDLPLIPEDISKAQRGYALFSPLPAKPERPRPVALTPETDAIAAFRAIAFEQLRAWQANSTALGHGCEPEFVHQARVALRRLRSAVCLFAPVLPAAFVARWRADLRELANSLGGARDADVVFHTLLEPICAAGPVGEDLKRLIALLAARREAARAPLSEGALAARQGRAQLELAAALQALHGKAEIPLAELARERLRRTRRLSGRAADKAAQGSVDELHRLRILFKRLRYGLDFFAPLWDRESVAGYAQALATLQEELGALNDAAVGNRMLAELAGDDPGLAAARAFASGWHAPRIARLRQQLPEKACELLARRPPWKKKD